MIKQGKLRPFINYLLILSATFMVVFFNGCVEQTQYNKYISLKTNQHLHNNLHTAISDASKQLFKTTKKENLNSGVIVTSFVSLKDFKKTTQLGRLLGESMISELHTRGFKVIDFRGRDALVVNKSGEFYITREAALLKDEIENANILVGTYSQFDQNSILINIRILEFETGNVIGSARVVYTIKDCKLLSNCKKSEQMNIVRDK